MNLCFLSFITRQPIRGENATTKNSAWPGNNCFNDHCSPVLFSTTYNTVSVVKRGALCLGSKDQHQQSLLYCSTSATDRSLIVPQHFLTSEEFLLQEIWFTREGTKPSHSRKKPPTPPSPSWQYLLHDPLYPFPFHPSGNILSTLLPAGKQSPRVYPTRGSPPCWHSDTHKHL